MSLFDRTNLRTRRYGPADEQPSNEEPEEIKETKEPEEIEIICINCRHHVDDDGDHRCYANATKIKNYVTGEEDWEDVEDCEDINSEGDCEDFEAGVH